MEESSTVKIQGEVTRIFSPSNWDFNEIEYSRFLLKAENDEKFYCCGHSFEIFSGEFVSLEGEIRENDSGKRMYFENIKIELKNVDCLEKYLAFVCGKVRLKSMTEYVLEGNTRAFVGKKQEKRYALERIQNLLETENVTALTKVPKIGKITAEKIIKKYKDHKGFETLYNKLAPYGLSLPDCLKIKKSKLMKGKDPIEILTKNPFKLMDLVEFSFSKCDLIFAKNGGTHNAPCRIMASIYNAMNDELGKGHTFVTMPIVLSKVNSYLSSTALYDGKMIDSIELNSSFEALIKFNKLYMDKDGRIYFKYIYDMEDYMRDYTKKVLEIPSGKIDYSSFIEKYEKMSSQKLGFAMKFGIEQKASIQNSLNNQVSIITGGPGTGKTSSLACIVYGLLKLKNIREEDIALCAPTGKAARRMMESINGQLGTNMIATTIHSLLEVDPTSENLEKFMFNENNKLPKKAIVVDEVSMMDLFTTYSLFSAIRNDTIVLLVGDIEQLPPVKYGYFLRDAILSKIPCVKLTEVHRQKGDSTIIGLSQAIRDEVLDYKSLEKQKDYAFVDVGNKTYDENINYIVNLFVRAVQKDGIDNVVVLTPLKGNCHDKKLGGQQISMAIQDVLLPNKEDEVIFERNGWKFKIDSKVIVTKNDNAKGIVNGEIGYITGIDVENKQMSVAFPDKDEDVILENDNIDFLKLAYAITVHKSQGSEWKDVIYVCTNDSSMNKKPLVYTAITRAKQNLVIVGNQNTFLNCIHNKEEYRRSRILN